MSGPDPISTRLGRKVLIRTLLAGLAPLILFAVPFTITAERRLAADARQTLSNYARLAGGEIFQTLSQGRAVIRAEARDPEIPAAVEPFRRFFVVTPGETSPWGELDVMARSFLDKGQVVLSPPYRVEEAATVSLLVRRSDGRLLAGEFDPLSLWEVSAGTNFGPRDRFYVLDADGRVLVSSHPHPLLAPLLPEPPQATSLQGRIRWDGEDFVWALSDVWLEGSFGRKGFVVFLARPEEEIRDLPRKMAFSFLLLLGLAFAVLVLLSTRFARDLVHPIQDLAEATKRVGRVPPSDDLAAGEREDEIGELARAFREMSQELEVNYQERLHLAHDASLGRIAARLAHKINNPLLALRIRFELLSQSAETPDLPGASREDIAVILRSLERISLTVQDLLRYARESKTAPEEAHRETNLARILSDIVFLYTPAFREAGVDVEVRLEEGLPPVRAAHIEMEEAFTNLVENAREVLTKGNHLRITARLDGSDVEVVVEDDGPGLGDNPDVHFEPFRTTKIWGTGIGLSITRQILKGAGGEIRAENRPEGGSRFVVRLPKKG